MAFLLLFIFNFDCAGVYYKIVRYDGAVWAITIFYYLIIKSNHDESASLFFAHRTFAHIRKSICICHTEFQVFLRDRCDATMRPRLREQGILSLSQLRQMAINR